MGTLTSSPIRLSGTDRQLLRQAISDRRRLRTLYADGPGGSGKRQLGRPLADIDYEDLAFSLCALCDWERGPFGSLDEAARVLCQHLALEHREK